MRTRRQRTAKQPRAPAQIGRGKHTCRARQVRSSTLTKLALLQTRMITTRYTAAGCTQQCTQQPAHNQAHNNCTRMRLDLQSHKTLSMPQGLCLTLSLKQSQQHTPPPGHAGGVAPSYQHARRPAASEVPNFFLSNLLAAIGWRATETGEQNKRKHTTGPPTSAQLHAGET